MVDLNVRENTALTALDRLTAGPFVSRRREVDAVERELVRAGGQGAVARGAGLVALRRQPAEGRDGARDAVRAGDPRRRRADAGRRRRGAGRDLPHPPRGLRERRAGRGRLERHPGAGGTLRPRDRDVAGQGRRDARGRRRHGGADRPRRDQRDGAHRGAADAEIDGLVEAHALHRGRLRARARPRRGHARARRVRAVAERPLPLGFQHQLGHVRLRRARIHLARADVRAASRRHRSLRRPARRLPRRRWRRSSCSTGSHPRSGRWGSSSCSCARSGSACSTAR